MKVSGFTFVRNAIKFNYPIIESIHSLLPLCDEYIVAVGDSDDGTLDIIKQIGSPKLKIIETIWDASLREGGRILAQQTDIALSHCNYEWCFYLQADEVLHEKFYPNISDAMEKYMNDKNVQGLLFDYVHFYGSYWTVGTGRHWYRREVRLVRNNIGVKSYRDAQGFRVNGKKLRVKHSGAQIYHYGWAKPPQDMTLKQKNLDRFWHKDEDITKKYSDKNFHIFGNLDEIEEFTETHPAVMSHKVGNIDPQLKKMILRARKRKNLIQWIEENILHFRLGEYKNYKLI